MGNLPYHPAMMLKILIYAYSTGVFSSRRIARHIEENIAFRVLAAGNTPDHRTICRFREQHLAAFERLEALCRSPDAESRPPPPPQHYVRGRKR